MYILDWIKSILGNGKKNVRFYTKTLEKNIGDPTPLEIGLYDRETPITNEEIGIEVNGKQYIRTTDNDGIARLNINLAAGNYTAKLYWRGINGEYNSVTGYVDIIVNPAPEPEPQPETEPEEEEHEEKTYSQEILEYFESKFGEMGCIDDCLEAIQGNGYGYYYDDAYTNYTSINRMANGSGVNCTDSCHVFWHLAVALGYRVEVLHIQCSGGDGHVRLELERESTGTGTFYRDPAACLDGNDISYNWCTSGYTIAVNPDWFFENLYR